MTRRVGSNTRGNVSSPTAWEGRSRAMCAGSRLHMGVLGELLPVLFGSVLGRWSGHWVGAREAVHHAHVDTQ
jgi:hypothetical protein